MKFPPVKTSIQKAKENIAGAERDWKIARDKKLISELWRAPDVPSVITAVQFRNRADFDDLVSRLERAGIWNSLKTVVADDVPDDRISTRSVTACFANLMFGVNEWKEFNTVVDAAVGAKYVLDNGNVCFTNTKILARKRWAERIAVAIKFVEDDVYVTLDHPGSLVPEFLYNEDFQTWEKIAAARVCQSLVEQRYVVQKTEKRIMRAEDGASCTLVTSFSIPLEESLKLQAHEE